MRVDFPKVSSGNYISSFINISTWRGIEHRSSSLNICIVTHEFIQFVYLFEPILAPKRLIDKYFDYIKPLKPCGEDLKYDRFFSLWETAYWETWRIKYAHWNNIANHMTLKKKDWKFIIKITRKSSLK